MPRVAEVSLWWKTSHLLVPTRGTAKGLPVVPVEYHVQTMTVKFWWGGGISMGTDNGGSATLHFLPYSPGGQAQFRRFYAVRYNIFVLAFSRPHIGLLARI